MTNAARLVLMGAALLALNACESKVSDAKAQLDILQKSDASPGEICDAKRKLADAYLDAHDAEGYQSAKLDADIECRRAEQQGRLGT